MTRKNFREIIDKDDYWMGLAFMHAGGSISIKQQCCIIIDTDNQITGIGLNGSLRQMPSAEHVVHAEINAIFNCDFSPTSGIAYLTHTPCYHCVLSLIAAGIKKIIYFPTKKIDENITDAAHCAYIQIEEFNGNLNWLRDYIKSLDIFETEGVYKL